MAAPIAASLLIAALWQGMAVAAPVTLTLGTLAPEGTSYHKALLEMREKWRAASGNQVQLRIYAGGKIGGEAKMVGQMRMGALDAALLTSVGLTDIERAVTGLQIMPMVFRSYDELDYVSARLEPMLAKKIEAKGFVVLYWADAGWVRFFSKMPVLRPDDLRKHKLFTWAGDSKITELWKAAGFNVVPLETADIVPMLDTGMITAIPAPPVAALAGMMYERVPNMTELNWAPLVGAFVMRKASWEKIPPDTRAALQKIAAETGTVMRKHGRDEGERAVKAMQAKGLKVWTVGPELEAEWRKAAEEFYPRIKGQFVPADIWDEVHRLLKEYREGGGRPKS